MANVHSHPEDVYRDRQLNEYLDSLDSEPVESIFLDEVDDLEPERIQRPDGTYLGEPTLMMHAAGITFERYQKYMEYKKAKGVKK